ncbi:MAG: entericidin [Candidatus Omnitrophota bacterium]
MRKIIPLLSLLILAAFLAGCGETVKGAVKDTKRIGSGVRKVFISDND